MAVQPFFNIVGSSFDDYVSTQLSKRADYLLSGAGGKGNEFRTPDQVEFLTNTNGWLRISSGVRLVTSKTFQNIIWFMPLSSQSKTTNDVTRLKIQLLFFS